MGLPRRRQRLLLTSSPTIKRSAKLCISAGYWMGVVLHRGILRLSGRKRPATCVTLCYHTVCNEERGRFAHQMDLLRKYALPLSANDARNMPEGNHCAVVTFDDGFQSVYENALPVLTERKIPATIFITTGSIGGLACWADEPSDPNPEEPLMTENQIRRLSSKSVTIGSHTVTHPEMCSLNDTQIEMELVESKKRLQSISGKPVSLFSVPYSRWNANVAKKAREAGYTRLFGGMVNMSEEPDPGYVRRIRVSPSDWAVEFKLKLLGAYGWMPAAARLKQATNVFHERP